MFAHADDGTRLDVRDVFICRSCGSAWSVSCGQSVHVCAVCLAMSWELVRAEDVLHGHPIFSRRLERAIARTRLAAQRRTQANTRLDVARQCVVSVRHRSARA